MMMLASMTGHTNGIWDIAVDPVRGFVLSASADGTIKLWDPSVALGGTSEGRISPLLRTFVNNTKNSKTRKSKSDDDDNDGGGGGGDDVVVGEAVIPTCVQFLPPSGSPFPTRCIAGYVNGDVCVFDLETGEKIFDMKPTFVKDSPSPPSSISLPSPASATPYQINKIAIHSTLPLAIAACEDNSIRYYDTTLGKCVETLVAHPDSVSSVHIDSMGLYVMTGGHDGSVRWWDLSSRMCVHEVQGHRNKFDESVLAVAYHPSKGFAASAGADSVIKIYHS